MAINTELYYANKSTIQLTMDTLITNPSIRILHREGVIYAGLLSGTTPPVRLVVSDIVLLDLFCKGGAVEAIAKQLHTGSSCKY